MNTTEDLSGAAKKLSENVRLIRRENLDGFISSGEKKLRNASER